jgi:hypothetical protein
MGRHDRKHSRAMRDACVYAVEEQGMAAHQVVTLAAAGQLKQPNGRRLPPFEIAESTVKTYAQHARRRQRERDRRAQTNGALEPTSSRPPRSPAPQGRPRARARHPARPAREGENDYEHAHANGLECECPQPDPSVYNLTHGRVCHRCHRPTTARPVDAR